MTAEGAAAPTVSLVVGWADVAPEALRECLESLQEQRFADLEVLLASPEGRPDLMRVVREAVRADDRLAVLPPAGPGRARQWDAGAAAARGELLGFVDGADRVPPAGVARLVRSLADTGSDLAFGRVADAGRTRWSAAEVGHPAHDRAATSASLGTHPVAVTDCVEENRLYRTAFWRTRRLAHAGGSGAGAAFRALLAAVSFDVLAETTYQRVHRAPTDGSDTGLWGTFEAWLRGRESERRLLAEQGSPEVLSAWAAGVLDLQAPAFLDEVERATPDQWQALTTLLRAVRAAVDERTWRHLVRAETRTKTWLALAGERDALARFVAHRLFEFGHRPTEVVGGRVLARFGELEAVAGALPEDCLEMGPRETALRVHLHRADWQDEHRLALTVFASAAFVGFTEPPELEARLVHAPSGRAVPLPVEPSADLEANVHGAHRHQDYSAGAARVFVDLRRLSAPREQAEEWDLHFVLRAEGLVREGGLTSREDRSSVGLLGRPWHAPRPLPVPAGGPPAYAGLRARGRHGVVLRVAAAEHRLVGLDVTAAATGRTVTGRLAGLVAGAVVAVAEDGTRVRAPLRTVGDAARFELELPGAADGVADRWRLRVRTPDGRRVPAYLDPALRGAPLAGGLRAEPDAEGAAVLVEARPALVVDAVRLEPGGLRLLGRRSPSGPHPWRVALVAGDGTRVEVELPPGEERVDVALPTSRDVWGLGPAPVPPGLYRLQASGAGAGADRVPVEPGAGLVPRLMVAARDDTFRLTPVVVDGEVALRLEPPFRDDERGPYAQEQLRRWSETLPVDPRAVYLQSYDADTATDSPRAVHEELRRTRPDLTAYWAVSSSSVRVPEGGVPVLVESREWHRVRGTAAHLVNNVDFGRSFERKPGQRVLQTFHGYPAKSMGLRLWQGKGFTPARIVHELRRTSGEWDLILTPCPEMDRHYREQYAYDGEIESSGYPRDDALMAPDAEEVRERTRRLLGVGPGQTAVLYAPTWRDDQATGARSAALTRHLDLEAASARLGPDFVLLMRGHRYHAPDASGHDASGPGEGRARLLDVTRYPEVNDLILAADAAVLDYSSLRFDFALTGKPMLFLVPDLADYTGGVRGFLFPFEESAPGPLVDDAEQVVDLLLRLPEVRAEHAAAYAAFNARFNHRQDGRAAQRVVARFFR